MKIQLLSKNLWQEKESFGEKAVRAIAYEIIGECGQKGE